MSQASPTLPLTYMMLLNALPQHAGIARRGADGWSWIELNHAGAQRWSLGALEASLGEALDTLPIEASCEIGRARLTRLDADHALLLAEPARERSLAEAVLDEMPNPVFAKDSEHRWILVNQAFCDLLHQPREALLGRSDYDFVPKEHADTFWQKDEEVFASGQLNVNEEPFMSQEGDPRWLLTRKTPIGAGELRCLIGVITDITDRKRFEAELVESHLARERAEAASRSKSTFLANMSHELRTPLNAIIGYGEILLEDIHVSAPETAARDIERILSSARHLLRLVDGALDMTRIEAGRVVLHIETLHVVDLCDHLEQLVAPLIAQTYNRFVLDVDASAGAIRTDRERLVQSLSHLLDNAAKFTQHGEITLRVERQHEHLLFHVIDTGIGIPPHRLDAIFELFTQADETTTRRFGGTGLGLTLARRSCQMLGGDVTVTSVPGRGSTFTARIAANLTESPSGEFIPALL